MSERAVAQTLAAHVTTSTRPAEIWHGVAHGRLAPDDAEALLLEGVEPQMDGREAIERAKRVFTPPAPEHRQERRQLRAQHVGHLERDEPLRQVLRAPRGEPQAVTARERPDQDRVARSGAHEPLAHHELRAHVPARVGEPVRRPVRPEPARLGERAGVAPVGLHVARVRRVHRRVARVGDDHLVPERLQAARRPLTLGGGLEQDARRRPVTQDRGEARGVRADPPLDERSRLLQDAELRVALVQIEPDAVHGWPPR